jgi:hypothetical protein
LAGDGQGTVLGTAGGINCTNSGGQQAGDCQGEDLRDNTTVTLSATPQSGSSFAGWSGSGITCAGSSTCTVTLASDLTITATFEPDVAPTQTLTVTGSGAGSGTVISDPAGIDCAVTGGVAAGTGCSATFPTGESVSLGVQSGQLIGFGGACTGTTCSLVMSEPRNVVVTFQASNPGAKLVFVGQPSAVQAGNSITPPVQVEVRDANDQLVATSSDAVTIAIGTNPGGGTLGGTVTRNAQNGIATFNDLTVGLSGEGYTLTAAAAGLAGATSNPFDVTDVPVASLAFVVQPPNGAAGVALNPAVQVEIRDDQGARLTTRTDQITLALQPNAAGATLSGTATATAVAGLATFPNLIVQKAGTGFSLSASTQAASGTTSSTFDIAAGAPAQIIKTPTAAQQAPVNEDVPIRPAVQVLDAFNNPVAGVNVHWEVTAGGGQVVASNPDPDDRPTGPLGLSTAVSWTLGPDVGNNNNELTATVDAPIAGNVVKFLASGTIPPGQGIFTGTLKRTTATGITNETIAGALLNFSNYSSGTPLGTGTSRSDGTFTSPPLAAGVPVKIDVSKEDFKDISYAKPALAPSSLTPLGDLGMVLDVPGGGQTTFNLSVGLDPAPSPEVDVIVEIHAGYFVGDPDPDAAAQADTITVREAQADLGEFVIGDWAVLTLVVSADGYKPFVKTFIAEPPGSTIDVGQVDLSQ